MITPLRDRVRLAAVIFFPTTDEGHLSYDWSDAKLTTLKPLTLEDFKVFFELLPTRADS